MKKYDLTLATKGQQEELTSRLFKVISKPVGTFLIRHTPFTANQVTIASYFALIFAALFFVLARYSFDAYAFRLIGAGFAVLLYLLDDIDGMIARAKFQASLKGKWMDSVVGFVFPPLLFFTLAYSLHDYFFMILGALAMVCFPLQYSYIYSFKLDFQPSLKQEKFLGFRKESGWRYLYGSATIYPILFFSCLFNIPWFPLLFYATLGNLFWILVIILQFRSVQRYG